jgi:hypothetical protein
MFLLPAAGTSVHFQATFFILTQDEDVAGVTELVHAILLTVVFCSVIL